VSAAVGQAPGENAASALGDAMALLAEYQAAPARERNYRRAIWAGLMSQALTRLVWAYDPEAMAAAFENGQDCFAAGIAGLIHERTEAGSSCDDLLDAIEAVVVARLEVGMSPAGWFE
jgi:hypothetical protein